MALVIGLTGGIGSGKTSVANMLEELGATVIDTDEIAHSLTAAGQPGARRIGEEFGAGFLSADGALDRARMRELVFSDPSAKKKLEGLLHPMIRAAVTARTNAEITTSATRMPAPYIVLVVPLLIETGAYKDLVQRILVVDCDEALQLTRVAHRSNLSQATVRAIMANQVSRAERLRHADDIVPNDGMLPELRSGVAALHRKYLGLAGKSAPTG